MRDSNDTLWGRYYGADTMGYQESILIRQVHSVPHHVLISWSLPKQLDQYPWQARSPTASRTQAYLPVLDIIVHID
jgi:hypothetical protein